MNNINYESLSNEELVQLSQKNDKEARKMLVYKNDKIIHMFARKYAKYDKDDDYLTLYQEGVIGLLKSIDRFKPELGNKFVTYAGNYIEGQMRWHLREGSDGKAFRIGREWKYLYNKINRAKDKLRQDLLREPTCKDIANFMNIPEKDVEECIVLNERHTSIYLVKYKNDKDSITIEEGIMDESYNENFEIEKIILKDKIDRLPEKEKQVIQMKYFEGKTQREIGEVMGTTQVQASRREKRAIKLLKEMYRKEA